MKNNESKRINKQGEFLYYFEYLRKIMLKNCLENQVLPKFSSGCVHNLDQIVKKGAS